MDKSEGKKMIAAGHALPGEIVRPMTPEEAKLAAEARIWSDLAFALGVVRYQRRAAPGSVN